MLLMVAKVTCWDITTLLVGEVTLSAVSVVRLVSTNTAVVSVISDWVKHS